MTKKKAHTVSVRLADSTFRAAEEKAQREGVSLSSIIRAFVHLWGHDEVPRDWPPKISELDQRAPEAQPRPKRGRRPKPPTPP